MVPIDIQEEILRRSGAWFVDGGMVSGASVCRTGRDIMFKTPARKAKTMTEFHKSYAKAFNTACKNGLLEVVEELIEWPNEEIDHNNAIILAASHKHMGVVELLLRHEKIKGDEALVNMVHNWLEDTSNVDYIHGKALEDESINGNEQCVRLLLAWWIESVNACEDYIERAVNWAAMNNFESNVRIILTSGILPKGTNIFDGWPLCWAADEGNLPIAKLLLEHGVHPDAQKRYPLISAIEQNDKDMIKLLVQYGATVTSSMMRNKWYKEIIENALKC